MFKNIVLLDRGVEYLESLLARYPQANIILVAEKQPSITPLLERYASHIVHFIDYNDFLAIQHVEDIDYELIAKMKSVQIDIEIMLHRIMLNNPLAKDIYHQHLSFFAHIFKRYPIDLILCTEFNLSTPSHLIPFGLGKLLGIPTYALERLASYPAITINNYNLSERLVFQTPFHSLEPQSIVFYKFAKPAPRNLIEKAEALFGAVFVELGKCIIKRSFTRKYLGVQYSFLHKLYSFFQLRVTQKLYKKLATKPSLQEKYIYYSLHVEPEATIIGKTLLESQLTMIKMLSHALPSGWKLYVKEHPHQFLLNTTLTSYFLHNIDFFKNAQLYKEIKKLKNVELISLDISPKDLIAHSQAIATINGTATLEAMLAGKRAILFSAKASLFGILKNVLHIASYAQLKQALESIASTPYSLDAKQEFSDFTRHIADMREANFHANLFSTIEAHSKAIAPTGAQL